MNVTARDELRRFDAAMNAEPTSSPRSDFRRGEILEMNAAAEEESARTSSMLKWGGCLLALLIVAHAGGAFGGKK